MVTVPTSSSKAPNPPYPLAPEERQAATKASHPHREEQEDDDVDDWEKDDSSDDEDWDITEKPEDSASAVPSSSASRSQKQGQAPAMAAELPNSLRAAAGPPPIKKLDASHMQPSLVSLPQSVSVNPLESQVSLPQSVNPLTSQISLPSSSVYSSTTSLPQQPRPMLRPQNTGEALFGTNNQSPWGQVPVPVAKDAIYVDEPAELPAVSTPAEEFNSMNLTKEQRQELQPPLIPVETEEPGSTHQYGQPNPPPLPAAAPSPQTSWQHQQQLEADRIRREQRDREEMQAMERARRGDSPWFTEESPTQQQQQQPLPPPPPRPDTSMSSQPLVQFEEPPGPPPGPPPNQSAGNSQSAHSRPQAPEFYSIKQARWIDGDKLRTSPILTQNDNGPCPLLALVNALVMSTPEGSTSSLIETMRTREQVSLTLLIQAIISHLAEQAETELPDLDNLNKFLRGLHTGMNVNPSFIPNPSQERSSSRNLAHYAGGFEETSEMQLYGTFNVPLVHGWIPSKFDEASAYEACERSAKTYEDAQNIQFGEEELEYKLSNQGLTPKEQELFEDLHSVKHFLDTYPTQLTPYGLEILHKCIAPRQFVILFRNDHFSTLYKEPRSNQLMTLVTDAGYASHDEIIWESLVDVSGRDAEMFSGDFRPVSHSATARPSNSGGTPAGPRGSSLGSNGQAINSMLDVDGTSGEWSTVGRGNNSRPLRVVNNTESATVSNNQFESLSHSQEQEDHDLALALQLQEEEEARARRETEASQRDNVLEPQSSGISVPIHGPGGPPPASRRRSEANQGTQTQRPLPPPPRRNREDEDLPPPTYEQAASRPAFVPPAGHPASANAPVVSADQQSSSRPRPPGGRGRFQSGSYNGGAGRGVGVTPGRDDRGKDCVIM